MPRQRSSRPFAPRRSANKQRPDYPPLSFSTFSNTRIASNSFTEASCSVCMRPSRSALTRRRQLSSRRRRNSDVSFHSGPCSLGTFLIAASVTSALVHLGADRVGDRGQFVRAHAAFLEPVGLRIVQSRRACFDVDHSSDRGRDVGDPAQRHGEGDEERDRGHRRGAHASQRRLGGAHPSGQDESAEQAHQQTGTHRLAAEALRWRRDR